MGSKLDWSHKVNIWELYHLKKTPIDRIREEFETGQDGITSSWDTVRRVVEELPSLSQAQVRQLPDALQERWRELKSEAEQLAPKEAVVEQKPYKETPHKQKMRELAESLQRKVVLPPVLVIFLRPVRNAITLSIDQKENHLYQGLRNHLKTGGFSEVLEKIREWQDSAGHYLAKCHDLFKNVRGEILSDEVIVSPDGKPKQGLIIDDFCGTVCADVVGRVTGHPNHLGYKTERHFLNPDLWVLRYGVYGIYLGLQTEELEERKNIHKDLINKYVSKPATGDIATRMEKLSEIETQISRQLQKFSLMERLPGHCELC